MISAPRRSKLIPVIRLLSTGSSPKLQHEDGSLGDEDIRTILERLDRGVVLPYISTYATLVRRCTTEKSLEQGRLVHKHLLHRLDGGPDRFLQNLLLHMYAKCGSIDEAQLQFKQIRYKNEFTFTIMIAAYARNGHYREAIAAFHTMDLHGLPVGVNELMNVLKACSVVRALSTGRNVHMRLIEGGNLNAVTMTAVLNMYAKCGRLEEARNVFDSMQSRDSVAWNAMVSAYAQNGHYRRALEVYKQADGKPDRVTFITILRVCAELEDIEEGKRVHSQVLEMGMEAGGVGTMVVNMYAKCGYLAEAREVFDRMPEKELLAWNVMIAAYSQQECGCEALELYEQMVPLRATLQPDVFTFTSLLSACCSTQSLKHGKMIHRQIAEAGYEGELGASLVTMYSKCGSLEDAAEVFERTPVKTLLAWTSMISAYALAGYSKKAVDLLQKMDLEGEKLDLIGYICVLDACSDMGNHSRVEAAHKRVFEAGFEPALAVGLVDAYGKCGNMEAARVLFLKQENKCLPLWNAFLGACLSHELLHEMVSLFGAMVLEGIKGDRVTFVLMMEGLSIMLPSSDSSTFVSSMGKAVLQAAFESGLSNHFMVGTCIVCYLSATGDLSRARTVFDCLESKDVVAWNAMASGYGLHGDFARIVELYHLMLQEGVKPDGLAFIKVVEPCMVESGLPKVNEIHKQIEESGYGSHSYILTVLLEAYGKCGNIRLARDTFSRIQPKDVVSWSTMLGIYAGYAQAKQALEFFWEMNLDGIHPNEYTFLGVFVACSHAGLQDRAKQYVESMILDFNVVPIEYHYGSLVDLLGRAARVDEAAELAKSLVDPVEFRSGSLIERVRGKDLALSFE